MSLAFFSSFSYKCYGIDVNFGAIAGYMLGWVIESNTATPDFPIIYKDANAEHRLISTQEIRVPLFISDNPSDCPDVQNPIRCYRLPVNDNTTGSREILIREFIKEYNIKNDTKFNYMVDLGAHDKDAGKFQRKRTIQGILLEIRNE